MTKSRQIAQCSVCNIELRNRAKRGIKQTSNILCFECSKKYEKKCGSCNQNFFPTATTGTRYAYCTPCAREYHKNYKKGKTIKPTLTEIECLYCLKPFQAKTRKSKCCSHSCNSSYNQYFKNTGKPYRSSDLIVCKCGKLISHQYKSCSVCKSSQCSVDGCETIVKLHGLCNKHNLRLRRHGDVNAIPAPKPRRPRCSVKSCNGAQRKDALCLKHLKDKEKQTGIFKVERVCSYPGCDKKHHGNGLCNFHYNRQLNGTDLDAPKKIKKYFNEICLQDNCDKPNAREGHGLCKTHLRKRYRTSRGRYGNGLSWQTLGPRVNWICHLCGEQVEQIAGTWETPKGGNVDHLVPRSKGGTDDWDNVLLAHYTCNTSRSNKDIKKKDLGKKIDDARFASLDKVFQ